MKTRRDFIKSIGVASAFTLNFSSVLSQPDTSHKATDNKTFTILFQGDSITDGNRTRNYDWNHIMGHGYAYLIASRLWFENTKKNLMFINRGISGNKVNDLADRWQQDAIDIKPDVLSILIGINDILADIKVNNPDFVKETEASYRALLQRTRNELPTTRLVLCEPFILPVGRVNEDTDAWQSKIKAVQAIVQKLSKEFNASLVELQTPFNEACKKAPANYWIWDGIHPMPAGHELMARAWIKTMAAQLSLKS